MAQEQPGKKILINHVNPLRPDVAWFNTSCAREVFSLLFFFFIIIILEFSFFKQIPTYRTNNQRGIRIGSRFMSIHFSFTSDHRIAPSTITIFVRFEFDEILTLGSIRSSGILRRRKTINLTYTSMLTQPPFNVPSEQA